MKVAIIGGGIGGMTLALALHDAGIREIQILEAAPAVKELGVGINVLPHAVRELVELGLLNQLYATGIPTAELIYLSKHGQRVWAEPRGLAAGYRWPQISIHRGELLGLLYRAVQERLGPECVQTGRQLTRFRRDTTGGAWCEFARAPSEWIEADLVVGCDGVHSAVRRAFYPQEGPPHWNGVTIWRGITLTAPFLSGRTMIDLGHTRHFMVIYPISRRYEERGQALVNWVVCVKTADGRPMPPQEWDHAARREEALEAVSSYVFDFLDVPALVRDAQALYKYPMVDRDPLPTWDFPGVTLLGDAAHPMYPLGSNGASQAIIDARVLARELALRPTIAEAVAAYDAQRRPATAAVVMANRQEGQDQCLDRVEERAPNGFDRLDDVISQEELQKIADDYKRVAGFDPEMLNNRPSLSVRRSEVTAS